MKDSPASNREKVSLSVLAAVSRWLHVMLFKARVGGGGRETILSIDSHLRWTERPCLIRISAIVVKKSINSGQPLAGGKGQHDNTNM